MQKYICNVCNYIYDPAQGAAILILKKKKKMFSIKNREKTQKVLFSEKPCIIKK